MTDIKLESDFVAVEGSLKILGPDLKISAENRKVSSNRQTYRRALVHGNGDRLIVNFHDDYLGVEINGRRNEGIQLNGNVSVNGTDILDIINGLQEAVGNLMENQETLAERIKELEIKAGLRPTKQLESWITANRKLLTKTKIRIPTIDITRS
tara:strand:+ start:19052 stop:19510 length:459 start_codon:yes stop_codon:yes gene_type:complete